MAPRGPSFEARKGEYLRMTPEYVDSALTAHPLGYPIKIFGNNIPVARRLEIVFLHGAVFGRACNEGSLQTQFLGGLEVVIVGCNHHHLLRRQAEQARGAEIGLGVGLV